MEESLDWQALEEGSRPEAALQRVVWGWSQYLIPPSLRSPSPHLSLHPVQPAFPALRPILPASGQTMAYAREQQDHNPLFHIFVQVGEVAGEGGRVDLGSRQEGSHSPSPLPPSLAVV